MSAEPIISALVERRRKIRLSRKAAAIKLGISHRTLGSWERLERRPHLAEISAWAETLGLTLELRERP